MTDLLTVADVAKRLDVSEYRVREYVKDGRIDCIRSDPDGKKGGLIRFTERQYEQLLEALTVPAKVSVPKQGKRARGFKA